MKLCMYFLTCIKPRSVSKADNRISFLTIDKVLFYCIERELRMSITNLVMLLINNDMC